MTRARWLFLVAAVCAACASESKLPQAPDIFAGGGHSGADRMVQDIDGTVGASFDAGPRSDARASDAQNASDTAGVETGGRDTSADGAAMTCSLLGQNCLGAQQACYRTGASGSACLPSGGVPAGGPCTMDEDCVRGALCAQESQLCQRVCNTAQACASGAGCVALSNGSNVGLCEF